MKAQNSTPEEISDLVSQFAAKGFTAFHGGRKGQTIGVIDNGNQ